MIRYARCETAAQAPLRPARRIFGSRCLDRAEELVLQEDFIVVIRCEARVVIQQAFDLDPKLGCRRRRRQGRRHVGPGAARLLVQRLPASALDLTHSSDFQTLAGRGFNDRSRSASTEPLRQPGPRKPPIAL